MSNFSQDRTADEIAQLQQALEAETERCLELQRQLDRSNAGFEEFVSVAAHNLRESLRDVAAYSQLLAETHADRLDSEAAGYLDSIQQGAKKMQSLLGGVVDYWSTTTGHRQPSRTDMEVVFRQALLSGERQIAERKAIVTHDPLPPVMGDLQILTRVLHHLIANAIEFCEKPAPVVHISCKLSGSECAFSVQDNGPGIEAAFQGRIFEVFKRLHGKEHPGNGLGLAFCKKAVQWHGGRIWVASAPGEGSTFWFTLPAAE